MPLPVLTEDEHVELVRLLRDAIGPPIAISLTSSNSGFVAFLIHVKESRTDPCLDNRSRRGKGARHWTLGENMLSDIVW